MRVGDAMTDIFIRPVFCFTVMILVTSPLQAQQADDYRAVLDRYCVTCHNATLNTANLILDRDHADAVNLAGNPALWEKVLLKLKTRSMPPVGMPRPDDDFYKLFASYLAQSLDKLAVSDPNPGKTVTSHRLNRTEFDSAKCAGQLAGLDMNTEYPPVRGVWRPGPGSYGRSDAGDRVADAVVLSKAVGAPVRMQWSRYEGLAWDP